jgi:energy-coupling factor transport system ATP-binding protein
VALLRRIAGDVHAGPHPRDLPRGNGFALALAVVLTTVPPLLLLDEPWPGTRVRGSARVAR